MRIMESVTETNGCYLLIEWLVNNRMKLRIHCFLNYKSGVNTRFGTNNLTLQNQERRPVHSYLIQFVHLVSWRHASLNASSQSLIPLIPQTIILKICHASETVILRDLYRPSIGYPSSKSTIRINGEQWWEMRRKKRDSRMRYKRRKGAW